MSQKSYESDGSLGGRRENDPPVPQMKFKRQSQFARIDLNRKFDRIKKKSLMLSQRNLHEEPNSAHRVSDHNLNESGLGSRIFKSSTVQNRKNSPKLLRQCSQGGFSQFHSMAKLSEQSLKDNKESEDSPLNIKEDTPAELKDKEAEPAEHPFDAWKNLNILSDDDVASDSDFSDEKDACNYNTDGQEEEGQLMARPITVSVPHRNEVSKVGSRDEQREVIPDIKTALNPSQQRLQHLKDLRDNKIVYPQSKSKQEFEVEKVKQIKMFEEASQKAWKAKSHEQSKSHTLA